ncbi:MAG: LexA family protein [Candidatus Cryptobacteroides sp.]
MEDRKRRRGGARPGAGHPKGDSRMISFRAPGPLAKQLEGMENRTEFIRQAVSEAITKSTRANAQPAVADSRHPQNRAVAAVPPASAIPAGLVRPLSLPYYDFSVVAGFPVPLDNDERSQDIDILSMLCPHPEASYLIRVSGDSMIDAGVLSGDIVIVDKSNRNPGPHEIAMCELNGEYTLKHFILEQGQGWLVPANPEYPRIRINPEDDFSVWGTVTYIIHKARD